MENHRVQGSFSRHKTGLGQHSAANTSLSLKAKAQPWGFRFPVRPNSCLHPAKKTGLGGEATDRNLG